MIGAPTVNPREGDRRQKALAKALAARASALSRTATTGQGRGARTGGGVRLVGQGARPSAALSFLSGKGPNGFGPGGVNFFGGNPGLGATVAATQMPSVALPSGPDGFGPPGLGELPAYQGPNVPLDQGGSYFDPTIPVGQPGGQSTGDAVEGNFEHIWGFNSTPSSAPGLPGGLIPLGGGVFYDPDSGQLRGGGLV